MEAFDVVDPHRILWTRTWSHAHGREQPLQLPELPRRQRRIENETDNRDRTRRQAFRPETAPVHPHFADAGQTIEPRRHLLDLRRARRVGRVDELALKRTAT